MLVRFVVQSLRGHVAHALIAAAPRPAHASSLAVRPALSSGPWGSAPPWAPSPSPPLPQHCRTPRSPPAAHTLGAGTPGGWAAHRGCCAASLRRRCSKRHVLGTAGENRLHTVPVGGHARSAVPLLVRIHDPAVAAWSGVSAVTALQRVVSIGSASHQLGILCFRNTCSLPRPLLPACPCGAAASHCSRRARA